MTTFPLSSQIIIPSFLFKLYVPLMQITPEIVGELMSSRNRREMEDHSNSASTINSKPIKEDWFDMPQVPMEERPTCDFLLY